LTFYLLKRLFSSFFRHKWNKKWAEIGEWAKAWIKKKFNRELWCRFESEIREWDEMGEWASR
jgi:hypothetical protein